MEKSTELESALFKAVFENKSSAIEKLIHDGVDPNCVSTYGNTPLQNACSLNRLDAVETLLRLGANPNKKFTFTSPVDGRVEQDMIALHYATSADMVTALLNAGADVNATNANGTTPLMRAAFDGHADVVRALLNKGAPPFLCQPGANRKKVHTALEMAESKIELWIKLKNESRRQEYEVIRRMLLDAEDHTRVQKREAPTQQPMTNNQDLKLPSTKYRKSRMAVSDAIRHQHEDFIAKFRAKPNQAEARQWLAENDTRNLGEMTPEVSREVIEEGYKAGANNITAVDIQDETTDYLLVELPPKGTKRKKVFEWHNQLTQQSGFDPEEDWGQTELFIFFD